MLQIKLGCLTQLLLLLLLLVLLLLLSLLHLLVMLLVLLVRFLGLLVFLLLHSSLLLQPFLHQSCCCVMLHCLCGTAGWCRGCHAIPRSSMMCSSCCCSCFLLHCLGSQV